MKKQLYKIWRKFFWTLNRSLVPFVVYKKSGSFLKIEGDKLPQAPFILLANHANFLDPWIVAYSSPTPVSIMMNEEGFNSPAFTRWYLKNIGAFPKKKGMSDIGAMKKSISEIKAGYPLLVFPEGQTSWDGQTQPIYPGMEKMAQKMQIPIVVSRIEGNFLAHPWWADFGRKGQITLYRKTISAERVKETPSDALRDEIINFIKHNDIQKSGAKKFFGQNISAGMQNLLWICPHCLKSDALSFKDDSAICAKCKTEYKFNANLYLEKSEKNIGNLFDWVKFQKNFARSAIDDSNQKEILCESEKVHLIQNDNTGRITTLDIGKLEISKEKLMFFGDSATIEIKIDDIAAPVFQQKNIVQLEYPKGELKLMFSHGAMMKALCFLRELTGWREIEATGYFA